MYKKITKILFYLMTLTAVLVNLLCTIPVQAFTVDVSHLSYSNPNPAGPPLWRMLDYNFSGGTFDAGTKQISIPASFVQNWYTPLETSNSYILIPYPPDTGETNDISVQLNTASSLATLQTSTNGGIILSTTIIDLNSFGTLPPGYSDSATPAWTYMVGLKNITGLDETKTNVVQIGMGSPLSGPHPEFSLIKEPGKDPYLQAQIYDDTGAGSAVWQSAQFSITGLTNIADLVLELNITNGPAVSGVKPLIFQYRIGGTGNWNTLDTYNHTPPTGPTDPGYPYRGFPVTFPYVSLRVETPSGSTDPFHVFSNHEEWMNRYSALVFVNDPGQALYQGIHVTGDTLPGGGVDLSYGNGQWWLQQVVDLGISMPGTFPSFHIVATKKSDGTTDVRDKAITGYVADFVTFTSPAPSASVSAAPTFSWAWPGTAPVNWYYVFVVDTTVNPNDPTIHVMEQSAIPPSQTSIQYNGSLINGHTYEYTVSAGIITNGQENTSQAKGSFTYTGPSTITVSGTVKDWNGNVITTPVTVTVVGSPSLTTTTSTTDGTFSVSNVPAGTSFSLKLHKDGYIDVYTPDITASADVNVAATTTGSGSFFMPTQSDLTGSGIMPNSGKALLWGKVSDNTYRWSSNVGGVDVTAQGLSKSYPVTYLDWFGNLGGSSTYGNGYYYVLNVDDSDTVTILATKTGWNFASYARTFQTHANSVSQGRRYGAAPGYDASMSGSVKDWVSSETISGAHIELYGDPGKSTDSAGDGSYTFGALPRDATFYAKITAAGYVSTYAGPISLGGTMTGVNIPMVTSDEMTTNYGVTAGNGMILCSVVDQAMNKLSGATVTVSSKLGQTYTVTYEGGTNATGANGKFHVSNIIPGDVVKVDVTLAGYAFQSTYMNSFAPEVTAKYIRGSSSGNVSGAVTYSGIQTGNFQVKIWSADMMHDYSADLSFPSAGNFTFTNVPNGHYRLAAYRDSNNDGQYTTGEAYGYYQDATGPIMVTVSGSTVNIGAINLADPSVNPTGASVSINSTVTGVRGYLIFMRPGLSVQEAINGGVDPGIFSLDIDLLSGPHTYTVSSSDRIDGMPVPAGTYDFYFLTGDLDNGPDKGVIQYVQPGIVVNKGALTAIPTSGSIPFNTGGTVSGQVTSGAVGNHPILNVEVYLTSDLAGNVIRAWGKTDINGNFQFAHVPAGNYYLILSQPGYSFVPITVSVADGQTTAIAGTNSRITPTQIPGTISGALTPYGSSIESRFYLKNGEETVAKVTPSVTDGTFTITDVVPGTYTLTGSARGYARKQVTITVAAGQYVTNQNLSLDSMKNVIVSGINWLLNHQRTDGSFDDNLTGDAHQYVFGWTGYAGLTLMAIEGNPKYNNSENPDYLGAPLLGQIHDALYGVVSGETITKNGIKQYFESTYHATDDPGTGWNDVGAFYNSTVSWSSVAATPVALEKLIALGLPLNDSKVTGAVNFLINAQVTAGKASDPVFAGGWRYNPLNTDTDNWETAWVIMALMKAGVTSQAVSDGVNHIKRSQVTGTGRDAGLFRYQPGQDGAPLGTSAACVLALNFAREPRTSEYIERFFQWAKDNGDFSGFSRYADAYWWSMFPWAATLYADPAQSGKTMYDTLSLTWNMADEIVTLQQSDGRWINSSYSPGGSNSGNSVMYTASALMAIAPYAGLTPRPNEVTVSGGVSGPAGHIVGAKVEALLGGNVVASAVTDGLGIYALSVPVNYTYDIRVTATGYVRKSFTTANVGEVGLTNQDVDYTGADIDTTAPTISTLTPPNGQETTVPYQSIFAVLSDDKSGIDPSTIVFKLDGATVGATYNPADGQVGYVPSPWLLAGVHNVMVDVKDYAGNSADQAAWSFRLISRLKGDVNDDAAVNLADIILALQVISGMNPAGIRADYATSGVDVNGDNRIGFGEVEFNLQRVSGLRPYESGTITLSVPGAGHPSAFFSFSGGQTAPANPDFTVTNASGSQAPYSAYGWVNTSYGIIDLGAVSLNSVTEVPATGYVIPQSMNLTQGHSYAFKLSDGTYAVLEMKSVTPIASQGITMVFDYKYQPNSSRSF